MKNLEDKALLERLETLKNEKPQQKVLLVFPGKPQVEISVNYHELHRTFADLMAFKSKLQNGEDLKDVTLRPDDEYGHFCRDDAKGTLGMILEPARGVMLRFPAEEVFQLYRQVLKGHWRNHDYLASALYFRHRYFRRGKLLGYIKTIR